MVRRKTPPNVERMTSGKYRARIMVNRRTMRGPARKTTGEAFQDAQELLERSVKRGDVETIGQAFQAVLDECKRRKRRPATVAFYEEGQKVVEALFGAKKKVSSIRIEDVQGWVDEMLDSGNSGGTIRARLRVLRRAFIPPPLPMTLWALRLARHQF